MEIIGITNEKYLPMLKCIAVTNLGDNGVNERSLIRVNTEIIRIPYITKSSKFITGIKLFTNTPKVNLTLNNATQTPSTTFPSSRGNNDTKTN